MSTSEFYMSSLVEVIAAIESYKRRKKMETEKLFLLAYLYANRLAHSFDPKKVKLARPWDIYPDAFAEEQVAYETAWKQEELERYKERRRRAMDAHNAKNKERQEVIE